MYIYIIYCACVFAGSVCFIHFRLGNAALRSTKIVPSVLYLAGPTGAPRILPSCRTVYRFRPLPFF